MVRLFGQGFSASQIATKLGNGFTRNSVIGKLHRLGIKRGANKPVVTTSRVRTPNRPKLRIVRANTNSNAMRVLKSVERGPLRIRAVEIDPLNLELDDLGKDNCRYPYGDGPFTFCGHPKLHGSSYCAPHHALCWMPPIKRGAA